MEGIWKDGTHGQILELLEKPDGTLLYGYHYDFAEDGSKRYLMGAEAPEDIQVPDEFTVLHIPDQTYAVLTAEVR